MEQKIWRKLIQILSYRNDLIEKNKLLIRELYNKSNNQIYDLNDEKYVSFLKTLPKYYLEVLHNNGIIEDQKYLLLIHHHKKLSNHQGQRIEEIIKNDNMEELRRIIVDNGKDSIYTIIKSFNEVKKMKIPIMIYCIIEKAMKCFKYLLINDIQDPTETMQEDNPDPNNRYWRSQHRYEWDCMAITIYYGKIEMMKILEEKGIEKGNQSSHIEAAIFSFRNPIIKAIINSIKEKDEEIIKDMLMKGILATMKINNIEGFEFLNEKGMNLKMQLVFDSGRKLLHYAAEYNSKEIVEVLIRKGADINAKAIIYQIIL